MGALCHSYNEEDTMFEKFHEEALSLLKGMTIEEKIGQIFLARCPEDKDLKDTLAMNPGGFVMFRVDFSEKTKEEVIGKISYYQEESKLPLLISVDEEGGTVLRVSPNPKLAPERFKSPQELFEIGGYGEIERDTEEKSRLLKSLGINSNLNPVADISTNPEDYIYYRTLGKGPEETAKYVELVVKTAKKNGMASTLKHFPGYGNNLDTHIGSAYDKRSYQEFVDKDFKPFIAGIEAGAESIMLSHNIVQAIDPEGPASLSKKMVDVLRNELGFTGVIMTDDLSMDAIAEVSTPVVNAIKAGNDMLIVSDFERAYKMLTSSFMKGEISEDRIDESVLRILKWKYYLGLFEKV